MTPDDTLIGAVKLGKPAHGALAHAGIKTFADLAKWRQKEVAALHGIGPKTFPELTAAMAERGVRFKS
jgi:predicted flap endonuclease-1-like 5' DNA nuclease